MHTRLRFLIAAVMGMLSIRGVGWAQSTTASALAGDVRADELQAKGQIKQRNGETWWKLARLYQDAARYGDAEHAYGKALELLKTGDRTTFANAEDCMGTMYVETGRYALAEPLEQDALASRETERDSVGIGTSWMHLAMLSLGKHDLANAATDAELAVSLLVPEGTGPEAQSGASPEEKMTALINLSLVRCAQGACADALPHLRRALDLAQASYAAKSIPVGFINYLMGYAYWKTGDNGSASDLMKIGVSAMEGQLGWGHPTYILALTQYELFLRQIGHNADAVRVRAKITQVNASLRARGPGLHAGN